MNFRVLVFLAMVAVCMPTVAAMAAEEQILLVKIDGFADTKLLLVTDARNRIQGAKVVRGGMRLDFTAEQFKKGYTKTYFGFKAVSISSPDLDPVRGGKVQIEYRKEATMFSDMGKLDAQLGKDSSGQWVLRQVTPVSQGKPFKVLELSVRKEDLGGGDFKVIGIDGYKMSKVLDVNALLGALKPSERNFERMQVGDERGAKTNARIVVAQNMGDLGADLARAAY